MSRASLHFVIVSVYFFALVLPNPLNKPAASDKSEEVQPCPKDFVKTSNGGDCKKQITILNSAEKVDFPSSERSSATLRNFQCGKGYVMTASGECKVVIKIL